MERSLPDWALELPVVEGCDPNTTRLLAEGPTYIDGATCRIVVLGGKAASLRLAYINMAEPTSMFELGSGVRGGRAPEPRDLVYRSTVDITLAFMAQFAQSRQRPLMWAYDLAELVPEVARMFGSANVINPETFDSQLRRELAGGPFAHLLDEPNDPSASLAVSILRRLEPYMVALLAQDDPRKLVVDYGDFGSERHEWQQLGLRIRPDVAQQYDRADICRRLRAVLPGVKVDKLSEAATERTGDWPDNPVVRFMRGDCDPELWNSLNMDSLNQRLCELPNDPVLAVGKGQHPMQMLVTLCFDPDDEELATIRERLGARHTARAEPAWVYGRSTVSVLLPNSAGFNPDIDEFDLVTADASVRDELRFF